MFHEDTFLLLIAVIRRYKSVNSQLKITLYLLKLRFHKQQIFACFL